MNNNSLQGLPFGVIVFQLRTRKPKQTQEELAKLLGLKTRTIQKWENENVQPDLPNLQKLTEILVLNRKFTQGQEEEEAALLWRKIGRSAYFDRNWFNDLLHTASNSQGSAEVGPAPAAGRQAAGLQPVPVALEKTSSPQGQGSAEPNRAQPQPPVIEKKSASSNPQATFSEPRVDPFGSNSTWPHPVALTDQGFLTSPTPYHSSLKKRGNRFNPPVIVMGFGLVLVIAGLIIFFLIQNNTNATFLGPQNRPALITPVPSNYYSNMNLLRTLSVHTLAVNQVVYSPDDTLLFSASGDKTIKVWRIGKGQPVNSEPLITLIGHTDYVYAVAISANSRVLASTGKDQQIILWELDKSGVPTGKILKKLQNNTAESWSISLSPDGTRLAVPGADSAVELWDLTNTTSIELTGHKKKIREIRFSADGKMLATASEDGTARIWDVATNQVLKTFSGHTDVVSTVAFSPDGKFLVTGSEDNTLVVWDISSGNKLQTLKGHTDKIYSVAISPDGQYVASTGADRTIRLWEARSGRLLDTLQATTNASVVSLAFSPDGRVVVSGSEVPDHTIKFWGGLPEGFRPFAGG